MRFASLNSTNANMMLSQLCNWSSARTSCTARSPSAPSSARYVTTQCVNVNRSARRPSEVRLLPPAVRALHRYHANMCTDEVRCQIPFCACLHQGEDRWPPRAQQGGHRLSTRPPQVNAQQRRQQCLMRLRAISSSNASFASSSSSRRRRRHRQSSSLRKRERPSCECVRDARAAATISSCERRSMRARPSSFSAPVPSSNSRARYACSD